jgi:hypothetical protein
MRLREKIDSAWICLEYPVIDPRCGDNSNDNIIIIIISGSIDVSLPITVAARALSNTGIAGSNPTRGMDVCVRLFYVCVVLCLSSGHTTGRSSIQGVLPTVWIKKLKSGHVRRGSSEQIDKSM